MRENLTGQVFDRWTVGEQTKRGYYTYYICVCSCGVSREVYEGSLLDKRSRSCGCLNREIIAVSCVTHGQCRTPMYGVYRDMITRCTNSNYKGYPRYGGRGIGVSQEWLSSFEIFLSDMGPRPSPTHQLDRRDNNLGYSKDNCRWATPTENNNNRVDTILVEYLGQQKALSVVAEQLGIKQSTIYRRYHKGERGANLFRPTGHPEIKETK